MVVDLMAKDEAKTIIICREGNERVVAAMDITGDAPKVTGITYEERQQDATGEDRWVELPDSRVTRFSERVMGFLLTAFVGEEE